MIRIYLFFLLCIAILADVNAQDTFYEQYQFALDTDDEDPRYLYNIDDTIRLITLREVSAVGINFSLIDTLGNVISNVYHDDIGFFEEAILYDEEKEHFIIDGISRRDPPNKNCVFRLDKYGNLLDTKCNQYALPDDNAAGDVDNALHMTKTNFGYVSSGGEFVENGRYGFINIFDFDLNLIFSDTLSQFRNIGNIAYDGIDGINAIGLIRNDLTFIGNIDSMVFLKIDQKGKVLNQVRIPHTEPTLQLNGHYPFITDTISGNSYLFDEYDFDTTSTSDVKPRIIRLDQDGNIIWEFNNWQSSPGLSTHNLYLRKNGDLIAHGVVNFADVTNNLPASAMQIISIGSDGSFLWDRTMYELKTIDDQIERRYQFTRDMVEDSHNNIYVSASGFLNIAGSSERKPFLTKLTRDGCYTDECKLVVNTGDYHKPNNLVTERNEIHIYNKDTGHSYRYTFSPIIRDVWQTGRLLKSNSMSGDDTWEETGREIRGRGYQNGSETATIVWEAFDFLQVIPEVQSDGYYIFGYEVGDILELEHTFTNRVDLLEVIDVEDIMLLDGRTKKQFKLECQNLDPDDNPYPQRIWVEDIGDINDFLNTPYACSNPGNEVITCFFSDGELIWKHPDYDVCTVDTEDVVADQLKLFPNPTKDFLKLEVDLQIYIIRDSYGKLIINGHSSFKNDLIDVSLLPSGTYILSAIDLKGNTITKKFVKI